MFQLLPFDSELFGFPVAVSPEGGSTERELATILTTAKGQDVGLVYVMRPQPLDADLLHRLGGRLVDRKTCLAKTSLDQSRSSDAGRAESEVQVVEYEGDEVEPALVELAITSGALSRFRIDDRVPDGIFETLYRTWIERSVRHEIADAVLVARDSNSDLVGMITIGRHRAVRANIGLVAVAPSAQGKGVGKALLAAAERYCIAHGFRELQVVTQGENVAAIRLYGAGGFNVESVVAFHHFWLGSGRRDAR